jgi:cell division protein FtsX
MLALAFGVSAVACGSPRLVSSPARSKQISLASLGRVDLIVVPGSGRVEQVLDSSPFVVQYSRLPLGSVFQTSSGGEVSFPADQAACAVQAAGGFAVRAPIGDQEQLVALLRSSARTFVVGSGADLEVFMSVNADSGEVDAVRTAIERDHEVRSFRFLDHTAALALFKRDFSDQPNQLRSVTAASLPESFRLIAIGTASIATLTRRYTALRGVDIVMPRTEGADLAPLRYPALADPRNSEIFMRVDATPSQVGAIRAALTRDARVAAWSFLDHQAAYEVFKHDFANQPNLVDKTSPSDLPESFRVSLRNPDQAAQWRTTYGQLPAVDTVLDPQRPVACATSTPTT